MIIGLDIDNVITNFDVAIFNGFLIEDKNKRNTGIINKKARHIVSGMFDWTQAEIDDFFSLHMEQIAKNLSVRKNTKKYMDRLLADGHKLLLISNRVAPNYINPIETTKTWLEKHKINYTKLIISKLPDKTIECNINHVDVMVDDRAAQCKIMMANGVNCILMQTKYNKKESKDLTYATCWSDLYNKLSSMAKKI